MTMRNNSLSKMALAFLASVLILSLSACGGSNSGTTSQVASCVLIDNDYDIDDMMAIPMVIGNQYVAAIIQSEGYTLPEQGAAAIEQLVNSLPDQPNQRKIPIIVGGKQGDNGRALPPNRWEWIPFFRAMMNVSNGLLSSLPTPAANDPAYVQKVVNSVSNCQSVSVLIIGTYTSFVNYIDSIRNKVSKVVIMGQAIGDLSATPGRESFNCEYDLPACQTAMDKLVGLNSYFVDIPRIPACHTNPLDPNCYSPNYQMVAGGGGATGLVGAGLPSRLKQALLNDTPCSWPSGSGMPEVPGTNCSSQSTWVPTAVAAGPGGEMLFWDQSASLFLLHPELFSLYYPPANPSLGGKHYEPALLNNSHADTIQRMRDIWTQDTNKSTNYISSPTLN